MNFFLETIAALGLKVAWSIHLNELMKLNEYQRSTSFFERGQRSFRFQLNVWLWPVYSGEQFRASWPTCSYIWPSDLELNSTWPSLTYPLDFIQKHFEISFIKIGIKLLDLLECKNDFSKIWSNDLQNVCHHEISDKFGTGSCWFKTNKTQFQIYPRFHGDKHFDNVSCKLDQNYAF